MNQGFVKATPRASLILEITLRGDTPNNTNDRAATKEDRLMPIAQVQQTFFPSDKYLATV